jgi:acetoin utilization deacetylase AcuC-like enzyme
MIRSLRRLGYSVRRRLAGRAPVGLVVAPDHCVRLPVGLLDPWRNARILSFLEDGGLADVRHARRATPARTDDLGRVHDFDYLEGLERPGATERAFGVRLSERLEQCVLDSHRGQVGATSLAARLAVERGGVVVHAGGGFHHARRDRGAGFCLFNDVAIAIARRRERGFSGRVAVLDLDLHDGDGTRSIFAADATVHTYSIHSCRWDDDESAIESTSIELGSGVEDARYLESLGDSLPPLLDRFRPELAFFLAGVDPAADDALGDWKISAAALVERDRMVLDELERRAVPTVIVLAGGYGEDAWRHSARSLARLFSGGRAIEPPTTATLLMTRFRQLARELSASDLGETGDELLTSEDLVEALGIGPSRRLLGFYTRAGIELALERLGYFQELRELGFDSPVVEIETGGAEGDTMRVFASPARADLLVELRVRRDRSQLTGFELVWVEWLLLQNPRVPFTGERQPLPGQSHPGLGMLRETVAALVLVCDRLHLDGIGVTASHFHPAAHSLGEMHFLDPADEPLFRSLGDAVTGLPVAVACAAIEHGGLVDAATGEVFEWRPFRMILPVSAGLRERFEAPPYREVAARPGPVFQLRRHWSAGGGPAGGVSRAPRPWPGRGHRRRTPR